MNNQNNGNSQLNESRERVNQKVSRLTNIGNSAGRQWNRKRRHRSI